MSVRYVDIQSIIQVIGCVYKNPSLLDNEQYHFNEQDFTEDFHRILFASIYNLHELGSKEISPMMIENYLEQRPSKFAIYKVNQGRDYLSKLEEMTQLSTFDYYYSRMKKMTLLRMYNEKANLDLSWLYDINNILDVKKKQAQEDWLDNTKIEDIAETIDKKITSIRLKYVDNLQDDFSQAGDGAEELIRRLQQTPEIGYPMYGSIINTITRGARLSKLYLRSAATGLGKAIPNETLIPTPIGWRKVGDIKVGDSLFGQDGKPTTVLARFPQSEEKEIWEVTFSDGRIAKCCKDHLWEYRYEGHRQKEYRVESIEELYARTLKLKNGLKDAQNKGYRFHIRLNEAVEYPAKNYSVHPYVMGALLGDGSFRYSNNNKAISFSSQTDELPNKIASILGEEYICKKSSQFNYNYTFKSRNNLEHNLWVEELLKDYPELWQTKFIPQEYLLGSIEQRYDLLKGLLDTEGNISKEGKVSFTTVSPQLRDDVIELVRSLGMIATYLIDNRTNKYTTGECYVIHIQAKKEVKPNMFSLSYKHKMAISYAKSKKRSEYKDHLAIVDIKKTTTKTNMTCFTVDNDSHLFLMNDYIVTHNTRSMIADICTFACDTLYNPQTKTWEQNGTKEPSLFIATEQDIEEVQTMALAFISDVNEENIINGNYTDDEFERVIKASQILAESPLYLKQLPDFSLQDIESTIKYCIQEYKVKYVAFDYLHSSMKILSEVTSKAGVKGLREDNVLFMLSVKLKDICNQYGVFIITATQLNGNYVEASVFDQNLLRGAKSIADKVDLGMILLPVTKKDLEALQPVLQQGGFEAPTIKMSIYKNRRGRYKDILLWCKDRRGVCKIDPMFVTDYNYELMNIEDLKIKIKPNPASAF